MLTVCPPAILGLSSTLGCNLTNTLFPDDGNAQSGTSISAKAAGKRRSRGEGEEEEQPQPFASIFKYVVDLLQNAFPTLSTWISKRAQKRNLPHEQQIALQLGKVGQSTSSEPQVGNKASKKRLKNERMREKKKRRRLAYEKSGDVSQLPTMCESCV